MRVFSCRPNRLNSAVTRDKTDLGVVSIPRISSGRSPGSRAGSCINRVDGKAGMAETGHPPWHEVGPLGIGWRPSYERHFFFVVVPYSTIRFFTYLFLYVFEQKNGGFATIAPTLFISLRAYWSLPPADRMHSLRVFKQKKNQGARAADRRRTLKARAVKRRGKIKNTESILRLHITVVVSVGPSNRVCAHIGPCNACHRAAPEAPRYGRKFLIKSPQQCRR